MTYTFPMREAEVLRAIAEDGVDALDLLREADSTLEAEFKRVDAALRRLRARAQTYFPAAQYYTASGGFNLLLGSPHDRRVRPQQQVVALHGEAMIGDGDW